MEVVGSIILRTTVEGNHFLGSGYLCYGFSSILLAVSHADPEPIIILVSVRVYTIGAMFGIVCLYFGTRIFFKGSNHISVGVIVFVMLFTLIVSLFQQFYPNMVVVISTNPVISNMNLVPGIILGLWHLSFCFLSIYYLNQVRRSAKEFGESNAIHKLNLIIIGFILSICALLVYAFSNFGNNSWADDIFVLLEVADLIFIWRGLVI